MYSVLRQAEGPTGWLAPTALAAGVTGLALKIGSVAPELALHQAHIDSTSQTAAAFNQIATAPRCSASTRSPCCARRPA
jgi:hypothetical protein